MTDYTEPDKEELKPLLKSAREVGGQDSPEREAVALFDEGGELISGPKEIGKGQISWTRDGVEVSGSGPFTSYDDLVQSWRHSVRQKEDRGNDG